MRKALVVLTVAMSSLLWMGHSYPAFAKNLACQASRSSSIESITGASDGGGVLPASFVVDAAVVTSGNSALWSLSIVGLRFTGGSLTTNRVIPPSTLVTTCSYTLDSTSTSTSNNGTVQQTLVWDPVSGNPAGCTSQFTDDVYLIANGTAGVMIDDNLSGQSVPGTGTCLWQ